jgi:release factor glutamine methyltransferase
VKPREAVREVERELASAGVPDPRTDAELLVAHVLGVRRSELNGGGAFGGDRLDELRSLVERRRAREPLQHLLGEWGFRHLSLRVDGRALVPRPETEATVDRALNRIEALAQATVLDVGTGTGAIALALLDEHPGARVVGVDISAEALALAAENAQKTGLSQRLDLIRCDIRSGDDASESLLRATSHVGPFDLVVSNPPYIRPERIPFLEPEVRDHDPRQAILESGLTQAVVHGARAVLRPGGWLVVECGDDQDEELAKLFRSLDYADVSVTPDLLGINRVVEGRL